MRQELRRLRFNGRQFHTRTGKVGDWEMPGTINDTWGFKTDDHNWKSSETLIQNLINIASMGGNYLLNIGPKASGEIPAESIKRLKEMGELDESQQREYLWHEQQPV